MDNREARSFLSLHREGEIADEPRLAEVEKQAAADPELARWWSEEQEIDRVIAAKLQVTSVPMRASVPRSAPLIPLSIPQRNWPRAALLAAAAIVALAVLFGSWRGPFQPAASLADFRDEMVGFVKVTPSLELQTSDLTRVRNFLQETGAPSQLEVPRALRDLDLIGCRTLRYRGYDVALLCFRRSGGRIAHLLVVDRAALRGPPDKADAQFAKQGEWMTAGWQQGRHAYLVAAQGNDQQDVRQFLSDS
ncbi:MAG TPA: hypothetical protein VK993_09605 [Chthoniobacterales bacterium]|nr:hypothetical protein [Chthoniobacterales bacterium]